jgi:hypothetical protein
MSYYGFGYDEEAIYQDADIEMMEFAEEANRLEAEAMWDEIAKPESVSCRVYPCSNCGDVLRVEPNTLEDQYLRQSGQIKCDCGWALGTGYVERKVMC